MPIIDADCHVIESEQAWEYLDPADQQYQPTSMFDPNRPDRPIWIIDGKERQRPFATRGTGSAAEQLSGFAETSQETRTLADITARLAHMDELGVDVQVLFPTIFLTRISENPAVELALSKSYNRWLADIWSESNGRLRWAVVPPLDSMNEVEGQLRYGKENGACAIFMRGFEGDRRLVDPYFDPLYEAAQEYDLPVCIHAGCGNPDFVGLTEADAYSRNKLPIISAFHSMMYRGLWQRFPRLRAGFIEGAANWVPYIINEVQHRARRDGNAFDTDNLMADSRMYVTCQTNDDLPYIFANASEDNFMIGSDYGHSDTSSELEALKSLKTSGLLEPRIVDKVLSDNPARLYAID